MALVAQARKIASPAARAEALTAALLLWRGPLLAGVADDEHLQQLGGGLEETRLVAVELCVEAQLAAGQQLDVVGPLTEMVARYPTRERPAGLLMLALYRVGRSADAVEVYRKFRHTLVEELGLEPGDDLQQLHRQILGNDPMLAAPPPEVVRTDGPPGLRSRRFLPRDVPDFTGRVADLASLDAAAEERSGGAPTVVISAIAGLAGVGKTMLARALGAEMGGTVREVRTPEILDKWLGASERNMRRIFQEARRYTTPTVLLFDEFESIIGYAGAGDDSGSHAVNAVAGIFKQEMNGLIEANPFVIVVATTNFPALIDGSLIRSGRFDIKLEIPLPDVQGRAQILTRMIRALIAEHEPDEGRFRMFANDIDVDALAAAAEGMSGADLREVLRRAQMLKAMREVHSGAPSDPIAHVDLRRQIDQLRSG